MTMFLNVLGLLALVHVLTRGLAARVACELGWATSRDGEREVAPAVGVAAHGPRDDTNLRVPDVTRSAWRA